MRGEEEEEDPREEEEEWFRGVHRVQLGVIEVVEAGVGVEVGLHRRREGMEVDEEVTEDLEEDLFRDHLLVSPNSLISRV